MVALFAACDDDPSGPPPPEPPAQIALSKYYVQGSTGLASNEVTSFLVVSNGELWIGTAAGVSRYPSTSASARTGDIINGVNGLPHPQVRSMVEYSGKVYVGTWGGGLGVYDLTAGTWSQIRPTPSGLSDGFVAGISPSPTEDRLYLATNNGVFIYDPGASSFTHVETVDQILLDRDAGIVEPPLSTAEKEALAMSRLVSSVEVTENAGLVERWYGPRVEVRTSDTQDPWLGVLISKPSTTFRYTKENSGLVESNVNDIFYDPVRSTYWLAYVSTGISEVNVTARTWTHHTLVEGLPSNTIYAITRAQDNTSNNTVIWAATQAGLAKLVGNTWHSYGVAGGLPSERIRSLYSDDGQRLWAGFVDAGAVRLLL